MKNKKIFIGIVVILLVIGLGILNLSRDEDKKSKSKNGQDDTAETTDDGGKSSSDTNQNNNQTQQISNSQFPYTIDNTHLIISKIDSYDGEYLEDGTNSNIQGVSTILIKNSGSENIEYALVKIIQGNVTYQYKITDLPAKGSMVVQEMNKQPYQEGVYSSITAEVAYIDSFDKLDKVIQITENDDNSITIKNLTKKDISSLRIFYKYYMKDEKVYVGGITFNSHIENLKAGSKQTINPSHYVKD